MANYAPSVPDVKQYSTPEVLPVFHDPLRNIIGQSPSYTNPPTKFREADDEQLFNHPNSGKNTLLANF